MGSNSNDLEVFPTPYVAGFFEGDGCAYIGQDGGGYARHQLSIAQKDRDVLDRLRDSVGFGSVGATGSDGMHELGFGSHQSRRLGREILPHMRMDRKREKIEVMLRHVDEEPSSPIRERDLFWPYFAGVVDSDGCIGIYDQVSKGKTYQTPRLTVTQADADYLEKLVDELGTGSVSGHTLSLGSGATREVCANIRPHLFVKANDADRVLEMGHKRRSDSVLNRPRAKRARQLYVEKKMSAAQVAREVGEKPGTVSYWLRRMGVTRSLSETQELRRSREVSP